MKCNRQEACFRYDWVYESAKCRAVFPATDIKREGDPNAVSDLLLGPAPFLLISNVARRISPDLEQTFQC